jgi:hypothetical protein
MFGELADASIGPETRSEWQKLEGEHAVRKLWLE